MTVKTLLATLALTLAPGLAMAECSMGHVKDTTASSCAEGSVIDPETGSCVAQPAS